MPMKYAGDDHYNLFNPSFTKFGNIRINGTFSREFLINNFSTFEISRSHYLIFRYMGQSLYGTSTIARRWKEVTFKLNKKENIVNDIDQMIFKTIFSDRNTHFAKELMPNECECVWSGKELKRGRYDMDHLLPYSVWFNNDLWNMLPCDRDINRNKKSDKIPSPSLIEKRSSVIIDYWNIYEKKAKSLFDYQIRTALSSSKNGINNKENFIEEMCRKAYYLIHQRGYSEFNETLF